MSIPPCCFNTGFAWFVLNRLHHVCGICLCWFWSFQYTGGEYAGIPKLDDANNAGGRQSEKCTLILTEGDSAKALAISGLSVVGRDNYGVFPLRGKLLNVRDATATQVLPSLYTEDCSMSPQRIRPEQELCMHLGHNLLCGSFL